MKSLVINTFYIIFLFVFYIFLGGILKFSLVEAFEINEVWYFWAYSAFGVLLGGVVFFQQINVSSGGDNGPGS